MKPLGIQVALHDSVATLRAHGPLIWPVSTWITP